MITFTDILGQDAAIDTIRRAYRADRLPHGLLFAGPAGVGKASTAQALGALWLCENPRNENPCGQCTACKLFEQGTHPDYHTIYRQLIRIEKEDVKAKDLSIHVIRDYLIGPANMKSSMGRGKVFLVEEADLMNAAAQNALLKTLEEPAGRALIVLLTDDPLSLLPTIRSRCHVIPFAALSTKIVERELRKRGIADAEAADAATFAEGSLGRALRWLEDGVIAAARELRRRLEQSLEGRVPIDLSDWFRAAAESYAERQLTRDELVSKDQVTREGLSLYLRVCAGFFRQQLERTGDPAELDRLCASIEAAAQADEYLGANVNLPLICQQFAVTLESLFANPSAGGRAAVVPP